jgi:hypothetical protein
MVLIRDIRGRIWVLLYYDLRILRPRLKLGLLHMGLQNHTIPSRAAQIIKKIFVATNSIKFYSHLSHLTKVS